MKEQTRQLKRRSLSVHIAPEEVPMILLPHHRTSRVVLAFLITFLILCGGRAYGQSQTPGQVTKFDPSLNVVDSVITEDPSGKIGIGTTAPAAALDVAHGDLNLSGNMLKDGVLFLHNFGTENTFIGSNAGNVTMSGVRNTANGFEALENDTSGSNNTASGAEALEDNTTGVFNTANGAFSLRSNIRGDNNTANGAAALFRNTIGINNTANGFEALFSNTAGNNTANGAFSLFSNSTGRENTASGVGALQRNTSGSSNTAVGFTADVSSGDEVNATAIGAGAIVNASNKIRLGNSQVTVIEGQVPYTFTSDRNQKENFRLVDGEAVLRKLGSLNVKSWNYIGHDPQQFRHYGPVAQEFFAAFGHDAVGTIGTPTTINSGDLEGILMAAIQALAKQNTELRSRIEALERLAHGTTTGVR